MTRVPLQDLPEKLLNWEGANVRGQSSHSLSSRSEGPSLYSTWTPTSKKYDTAFSHLSTELKTSEASHEIRFPPLVTTSAFNTPRQNSPPTPPTRTYSFLGSANTTLSLNTMDLTGPSKTENDGSAASLDLPHQSRPSSQNRPVSSQNLHHGGAFECEQCGSRNGGRSPTCQICGHVRAPALMKSSFAYAHRSHSYSTYSGALSRESTSLGHGRAEQPSSGNGTAAPCAKVMNVCPSCHASDSINKGLCELCGFAASSSSKMIHPVQPVSATFKCHIATLSPPPPVLSQLCLCWIQQ
jgi:hypothetical protein